MTIKDQHLLDGRKIVVVGGTGNVGSFVVRSLLEMGAFVAVPSRSSQRIASLQNLVRESSGDGALDRLHAFEGDLSDETRADELRSRIRAEIENVDAVVASLGQWQSASSLLSAGRHDLERVLEGYLIAHFMAARTFLPELKSDGGAYIFVNGPLAFDVWPGSGASLVSIATAAQNMLFRALAEELEDTSVRVVELVSHAFLRDWKTQPSSPISGETVGEYVSYLIAGAAGELHGQSVHLRSQDQVREAARAAEKSEA
jgi:NAD(P)-dependent dehydrogenase (short-subunit alcohol dehydrogenase family)